MFLKTDTFIDHVRLDLIELVIVNQVVGLYRLLVQAHYLCRGIHHHRVSEVVPVDDLEIREYLVERPIVPQLVQNQALVFFEQMFDRGVGQRVVLDLNQEGVLLSH